MIRSTERWVFKLHPLARAIEPEDPMALQATMVPGDAEAMLQYLVQEYAWMGWDAEQILNLFQDPFYPVLHDLWCLYGKAGLRERLDVVLRQTGVFHFQATVREEPKPVEPDPELIQLGIRTYPREMPKGENHAEGL